VIVDLARIAVPQPAVIVVPRLRAIAATQNFDVVLQEALHEHNLRIGRPRGPSRHVAADGGRWKLRANL
jgi:hypothetical protein